MVAKFAENGIRFKYPENWRVEREVNEGGWTVSVQSPDTAFAMICLRADAPSTTEVAEAALQALRDEYPEVEADDCVETVAGLPAVGHDICFNVPNINYDLTNTCWTRSLYTPQGTLLVMCQISDLERETHEPVLRAICASLEVDEE